MTGGVPVPATAGDGAARLRRPRVFNAGGWVGLFAEGVRVGADGALELAALPDAGRPVGPALRGLAGAAGAPGGFACAGPTGYLADPAAGVVWALPAGEPVGPGLLTTPRGLLLGPRGRLYVADAGAGCVAVLDPATGTLVGRWADVTEPWSLAAGPADTVYVLDRGGPAGSGRVRRFAADGAVDPAFAAALAANPDPPTSIERLLGIPAIPAVPAVPGLPAGGAAADPDAGFRLLLVDRPAAGPDRLLVVDAAGQLDADRTAAWGRPARRERDLRTGAARDVPVDRVGGVAVLPGPPGVGPARLVVLDATTGELLDLDAAGCRGTSTPAVPAADLFAGCAALWSYPAAPASGDTVRLLRHDPDGARARRGLFVAGPVAAGPVEPGAVRPAVELRADVAAPAGAHVELAVAATGAPPAPDPAGLPGVAAWAAPGTGSGGWWPVPAGTPVALLPGDPGGLRYVGGLLTGDGVGTPRLGQVALTVGVPSWLDLLPATYRVDAASAAFLDRLLRLLASVQREIQHTTDELPRLFDPATAPDDAARDPALAGTALDRLAGWLAVTLTESWPTAHRRAVLAGAFARQAIRGTPEGLRQAARAELGLALDVDTPARHATLWRLPAGDPSLDPAAPAAPVGSAAPATAHAAPAGCAAAAGGAVGARLGEQTGLCPAPPGGAVLDATAVVDRSTLQPASAAEVGAPLFADLAHRFCVRALAGDVDAAGGVDQLVALIERDKPAHTAYHLCLARPGARIGLARLGVDAIVGGAPPPLAVAPDPPAGLDAALLTAPPPPATGRVGTARLGRDRIG